MVLFLADRSNLQTRQLHRRIRDRFQSDDRFRDVQLRVAEPRDPGSYRVIAYTDPRQFLEGYPIQVARIEVGFKLRGEHEFYWFNWIEPDRNFLVGWHQDDDHPDLGPVHLQVNHEEEVVDHIPAEFVDRHPMAVIEVRLSQLPQVLDKVEWEDGIVVGIDW